MLRAVVSVLFSIVMAVAAQAATINETDFADGFASPDQNFNPTYTQIGSGFDVVNGTLTRRNFDFIRFTSLNAGAQTVSLSFTLLAPNANQRGQLGGEVRYSTVQSTGPYTNNFSAGTFDLQSGRNVDPALAAATLSFNLDDTFAGGDLFVNILPTYGNRTAVYALGVPGNIPAAIPLPPAGFLLLSACCLMAIGRRARRHDLHPARPQAT